MPRSAASSTATSSPSINERGTVLGGAYVTERIMPGVVYIDHGAK